MIDADRRNAIYQLYLEGMAKREISRRLNISLMTVRSIIAQKGVMPVSVRKDKIKVDEALLSRLYGECNGFIQRIHENLTEEQRPLVGYSTLTRQVRDLGLNLSKKKRSARVPDEPGAEMQHDTSPYNLNIGDKRRRLVGSLIYLRYSKMRYLKFYPSFTRFRMKCFFHEALMLWGYAAQVCIIDNTNLARLRGSGKNALMVPEMEQFARKYGFEFFCHEIGHSDRKAGNERSFWTVETNFFPGRSFESLEDINLQAKNWATVRMARRPVSKTGLIPAVAFEFERPYLVKVLKAITPPYLPHSRLIDQYGYIAFDGNYYWIPNISDRKVNILQYSDTIKIYHNRKLLLVYPLPNEGIKNEKFSPKGQPAPSYQPKYRKKPTVHEEQQLRAAGKEVDDYLNFALRQKGQNRHRFIRELYSLYKKVALLPFLSATGRALTYRILDMATIERIVVLQLNDGGYHLPSAEIDQSFSNRETYRQGCFSDAADLTIYDKLLEDDNG